MSATRSRLLLAALSAAAAALLAATMTGPVEAAPVPRYTPPPGQSAPPPFTNLRVTAISPGSVTLSWFTMAPGWYDYRLSYTQAFDDIYRGKDLGKATSVTVTEGIRGAAQFSFTVSESSGTSRSITVMTPAGTTGDVTPPTAPTGLTNLGDTPQGSQLTWNASTDDTGVVGYNVYWFDGWYSSLVVASPTGTSAVAQSRTSGLQNGKFYVRARDAAGNLSIASDLIPAPNPPSTPPSQSASASPPPPPAGCAFTYTVTNRWTGGFTATWTLTNTGTAPINGWKVALQFSGDEKLQNGWSAIYTQTGQTLWLEAASWNRVIAPGQSATGGFLAWGDNTTARPQSATLDGKVCQLT